MILIDTGVWIDFLAGRETPEVQKVIVLLEKEKTICFIGLILQELMQGCSSDKDAEKIEKYFEPFVEIFPQRSTYKLAAKFYRNCRREGYTIRSAVDCLIAASATEYDAQVHHKDRDFTHIQKVCGLRVY
jgi:predicted nucleic acid-binding protein